ncbi:COMM domain-containing protein 7 isoform X2 [Artibeus jamaicensis]|uniref:COMM domain-containing protein 7 isoform X2 n=1 Tax=Artibeus jamaicensis TaxID=9417 RepID=UPI00235A7AA9|nr:COMM domain-containing protein 7 isoform X2 [Artibeus jamaicensis]
MGRLHCRQDPVPEAVGGDMQQLNQLSAQFSALTEVLFHFLTEPREAERFMAQLSEFATTNQISLGPLKSIVKSLLLVPNGALKKSLTAEQVRADFVTLGLSEEKATYFSEKWKQNAPTLARWAIGQTLTINQLIDMEWKFGVTSGSSELEKVGSIFLQLKLVVKKGNQTENLYIGVWSRIYLHGCYERSWSVKDVPENTGHRAHVLGGHIPGTLSTEATTLHARSRPASALTWVSPWAASLACSKALQVVPESTSEDSNQSPHTPA